MVTHGLVYSHAILPYNTYYRTHMVTIVRQSLGSHFLLDDGRVAQHPELNFIFTVHIDFENRLNLNSSCSYSTLKSTVTYHFKDNLAVGPVYLCTHCN